MITDEQVKAAANIYIGMPVNHQIASGNMTDMRKALEAYEQSKPKPEPYGWWSDRYGDWCNKDDKGAFPLYTTSPTREPLSEDVIVDVYENSGYKQTLRPQDRFAVMSFARAIEQTHRIGATSDQP